MFYVLHDRHDECGDGVRTTISALENHSEADELFDTLSSNSDTIALSMIEGVQLRIHTPQEVSLEPCEVNYLREQERMEEIAQQDSDRAREDEAERAFIREGYDDIPF